MTGHFDNVFDKVKAAVEALDYTVRGHANQIRWLKKTQLGSVDEMVAGIEAKLQKQTGNIAGGKKVRIWFPERANLETFAGDRPRPRTRRGLSMARPARDAPGHGVAGARGGL